LHVAPSPQLPSPAVSVLLPVRNGAAYLNATLASLAAQTFTDFEIILIDNGSTDSTPVIIREWERREPRLRSVRHSPAGLGQCLREGARLALAPLIARLDADDIAAPDRLYKQVTAMRLRPSLILLGSAVHLIDRRGTGVGEIRNPEDHSELVAALGTWCPFVQSSVIMQTEAYQRAGGYRVGLNVAEDYDLWCRMAEHGELANLAECLTSYRIHPASLTARRPARMALAALCVAAARSARRAGRNEPFAAGVPLLRAALVELEMSRELAHRVIRMRLIRHRFSRFWLDLPLPGVLKRGARSVVDRSGLRRSCLKLLGALLGATPGSGRLAPARSP
jgi:GT2 family glycosyltransferase